MRIESTVLKERVSLKSPEAPTSEIHCFFPLKLQLTSTRKGNLQQKLQKSTL